MSTRHATARAFEAPPGIDLQDLSGRLAEELRAAAGLAGECQALLGDIVEYGVTSETTVRMQALDALTQQLDELGRMFERLSDAPRLGVAPEDLLDAMRLADLKLRLSGQAADASDAGEPELF